MLYVKYFRQSSTTAYARSRGKCFCNTKIDKNSSEIEAEWEDIRVQTIVRDAVPGRGEYCSGENK